jgi:predicted dehydrogenase
MNRREFLGVAVAAVTTSRAVQSSRLRFAAIGLNHSHIHGQIAAVTRAGGELAAFYGSEPGLADAFGKRYPAATQAHSARAILEDPSIKLVVSAAIPNERAPLGIEVMRHGKDFMVDKPGSTTLAQLDAVRRVQRETNRIYSVLIERHESPAVQKAAQLVASGAIGNVIQTLALAPHKLSASTRPSWFFEREKYGGILVDLASHHIDQFLFFTGSTRADVIAAQVDNANHPRWPGLEDFGDVVFKGDRGRGYIRADWFTPDGLQVFGDGRTTILGTDGYLEIRKSADIAGRPGGNHVFLADHKAVQYFDCRDVTLPYGERLVNDVLNRTSTADDQTRTFLAMELAIRAEAIARRQPPSSGL